jgi:hypothetical protein
MMPDLVKAQNTPQFNWYTCWTTLGADSTPDKLIKEDLKQPNQIKIYFEKNSKDLDSKEIIGHVVPNQAWFGTEYFLAYLLPDFKSKILTQLLDAQKDDGPLLFHLMSQCFQGVCLTKWTSVIAKQCPINADLTKANFDKCIKDYLEAVAGFLKTGNQLIHWLCTSKKTHSYADAWVHAALSAASQLPWGWIPPSNNGWTYGTREGGTNLLCTV